MVTWWVVTRVMDKCLVLHVMIGLVHHRGYTPVRKSLSMVVVTIRPGHEIFVPYGSLVKWKNLPDNVNHTHPAPDPDKDTEESSDGDRISDEETLPPNLVVV